MTTRGIPFAKDRGCWFEQFKNCGCSYVALTRQGLMGYCPRHGSDRRGKPVKLPKAMEVGYAGTG